MADFICDKHKERYQDVNMCYKCLEEMENKITQLKADVQKYKEENEKLSNEIKGLIGQYDSSDI